MPKNPRVYELARELGLTNDETLALCDDRLVLSELLERSPLSERLELRTGVGRERLRT